MAVWFCDLFNNEMDIKYMGLVYLHHFIIFAAFDRSYARPFCKMTKKIYNEKIQNSYKTQ